MSNFIISHVRPQISFPPQFSFVTDVLTQPTDFRVDVSTLKDEGLSDRRIGEYMYLFALRRELENSSSKSITIAQYRRFVSSKPIGQVASNMSYARTVTSADLQGLDLESLLRPAQGFWLISTCARMQSSVIDQYAKHHIVRDWFRFLADAVDAGAIQNEEARQASLTQMLIPAPSNGVFPTQVLIKHLKILETAARAYIAGGFIEREEYQRRSLGFCLERLHSFLVLQEVLKAGLKIEVVSGYQTIVSETEVVKPTV